MRRISVWLSGPSWLLLLLFLVMAATPSYGQFDSRRVINAQSPQAIDAQLADIDNDDDLDVIVASLADNRISWYENTDGFGNFGFKRLVSSETQSVRSIYCVDLDGDGYVDVLSASMNDNAVSWHPNRGDGTFESRRVINDTLFVAVSVYAADIDGDGDLDVLSASRDDNKIAWYQQLSPGTFGPQQIISSTSLSATDVYAADIDGDEDIDVLAASEQDDTIAWFENMDGMGTFTRRVVITNEADFVQDIMAADIDNDGDYDVVSASAGNDEIAWYKNDGTGAFTQKTTLSSTTDFAFYVNVADLDADGDLDVLSASLNDSTLAWFPNTDGLGNFGSALYIDDEAPFASAIAVGNFDNDGDIDVVGTFENSVAAYESFAGRGRVEFAPFNEIASGTNEAYWAHNVHAADLDGDGDLDLMSASFLDNRIAWYENRNGVIRSQEVVSLAADGARDVHAADIDGDGDLDILSASGDDNAIKWYENFDGRGSFDVLTEVTTSADNAYAVHAADLDGDGDIDVVSASFDDDTIAWYENLDGAGLFGPLQEITKAAKGATDVITVDIDNDGDIDVVSASSFDDKIAWYPNMGDGTFAGQAVVTEDAEIATAVHAADIDMDGDIDLLSASGGDDKIAWYENLDGNGAFGQSKIVTLEANRAFSVFATDFDGDGDPDVLSASRDDNRIAWYENLDKGRFGPQQTLSNTLLGARAVIAADLDNDGDPDVIAASQDDNRIVWFENLSIVPTVLDADEEIEIVRSEYDVSVYPNPMLSSGYIKVGVDHSQRVSIVVYDIQGREVEQLYDGYLVSGQEELLQLNRNALPAGVYLIHIQGEQFARTEKFVLVK